MSDPTNMVIELSGGCELLQIDRPAGNQYCNFSLLRPDRSVIAYVSGYAATVEIVSGSAASIPFLRVDRISIPLPMNVANLESLAKFLKLPCPVFVEVAEYSSEIY